MIAARIAGATHNLGAPPDWDREKHGHCRALPVRVEGDVYHSAWEPTPAELAALIAGGYVVLTVVGGQPPVALNVEMPAEDAQAKAGSADRLESLAIRAALGNNGGSWAEHYTDDQKNYWRRFVVDLANDLT